MSGNSTIEITWASGSLDEARKISRELVNRKWVACAQIVPWIESIYLWNDQLETAQESRVTFKTKRELYETVAEFIQSSCSYEIPEITYRTIDGGNREYLEWLDSVTQQNNPTV